MLTRPDAVADAAVTIVARDGLRGLTHRAVDAEAGLPAGSASNCFRSRAALLEAIVTRIQQLDQAALGAGPWPDATSARDLAAHLAGKVALMASRKHVRATRARIALLLDETVRPAMEAGHHHFLTMLETMIEDGGHPIPGPTARAMADLLDGALVHAVAVRTRNVDTDELATAVERLLR